MCRRANEKMMDYSNKVSRPVNLVSVLSTGILFVIRIAAIETPGSIKTCTFATTILFGRIVQREHVADRCRIKRLPTLAGVCLTVKFDGDFGNKTEYLYTRTRARAKRRALLRWTVAHT